MSVKKRIFKTFREQNGAKTGVLGRRNPQTNSIGSGDGLLGWALTWLGLAWFSAGILDSVVWLGSVVGAVAEAAGAVAGAAAGAVAEVAEVAEAVVEVGLVSLGVWRSNAKMRFPPEVGWLSLPFFFNNSTFFFRTSAVICYPELVA